MRIEIEHDPEAGKWVVTSPDVIGLVIEHPDPGEAVRVALDLTPVLKAENIGLAD